jgi:hypothetical protein
VLRIRAGHVAAIRAGADLPALFDLRDGELREHGRIGKIRLVEMDKTAEGDERVGHGLGNFVVAILASDVTKRDFCVSDD